MKNIFFSWFKEQVISSIGADQWKIKKWKPLSPRVPSGIPCIYVYEIISASADSLHWAPILEDGLKMEANNH